MILLDFNTLTAANPANPPAGWLKPASAATARIALQGAVNAFSRSSGTIYSIWYYNTQLGSPKISAEFVVAGAGSFNGAGAVLIEGANANGYALVTRSFGAGVDVIRLDAATRNATTLASINTTTTDNVTKFKLEYTKATKTFKVFRDNVQIGSDLVDETYSPLYGGVASGENGGRVRSIEVTQAGSQATSITNPVVMGSAISIATTGFTGAPTVTAAGLSATGVSFDAGTGAVNATWPALTEGQTITSPLPIASALFTVQNGAESSTINSPINIQPGYAPVTFVFPITDDPLTISTQVGAVNGDTMYYETANGVVINSEGILSYDDGVSGLAFKMFLHKTRSGGDNSITEFNATTNEAGEIVITGLTSAGLTLTGLTARGLTAVGL